MDSETPERSRRIFLTTATGGVVAGVAASGLAGSGRRPADPLTDPQAGPVDARALLSRVREPGLSINDLRMPDDGDDAAPGLLRAARAYSDDPISPPGRRGWGAGLVTLPRGSFRLGRAVNLAGSLLGFGLAGRANYASALVADVRAGAAFMLKTYVGVRFQDFLLRNAAAEPGTSVAFDLDGTGGGGELTFRRMTIENFGTAIRVKGEGGAPGNGDKTLVEQVQFGTLVGFDNTRNKQAVGWTFLNCASGCAGAMFRLGGAGEVAVVNHVADVYGSLIELPEGSGNPGAGNYVGTRITVMSSKLEYHGNGPRMLLDARGSRLNTDAGGSNADLVFRDVSLAGGLGRPDDPASHVVMQVGDSGRGSDAVRVRQDGGWIEGAVRLASAQRGAVNRRWSFRDAVRAPDPDRVRFEGDGNHPLLEWRANENVPLDQYRGGEAFTGAIDAQKAFLWRHDGRSLINTGLAAEPIGDRRGGRFALGDFPRAMTVTGLAVFITANSGGGDTLVEWFADADHRVAIGRALIAADRRGLQPVVMGDPTRWRTLSTGKLHIRISKPETGDAGTEGALVMFYFPYMGT